MSSYKLGVVIENDDDNCFKQEHPASGNTERGYVYGLSDGVSIFYVGITNDLNRRVKQYQDVTRMTNGNPFLYRKLHDMYNKNLCLEMKVLETVVFDGDRSFLLERERYYVNQFGGLLNRVSRGKRVEL